MIGEPHKRCVGSNEACRQRRFLTARPTTFISHLAMAGVSEAVAQKLAGRAWISTTLKHYTGILPEVLRAAPLRLPYAENAEGVSKVYRGEASEAGAETTQVASLSAMIV